MDDKILFVDDDQNLLDSYYRSMRKMYNIDMALGPEKGLEMVRTLGPYAVVVSDFRMPVMDGVQFLRLVKELVPDTVRIMLTGNADMTTAMDAVNEGNIFRFLNKPCAVEVLSNVLNAGMEQYRLINVERELLEKTLNGSMKVLCDILAMVNPEAFAISSRVRRNVMDIAKKLNLPGRWKFENAAMLSQLGCLIIPEDISKKYSGGNLLNAKELDIIDRHPSLAAELLVTIPRMQEVAEIIEYQRKNYDGTGSPMDDRAGEFIPLGSRLLKIAIDFDILKNSGKKDSEALALIKASARNYDPALLKAFESILGIESQFEQLTINVIELKEGMILAESIFTKEKVLLIAKGFELTPPIITKLKYFAFSKKIASAFNVLVPSG